MSYDDWRYARIPAVLLFVRIHQGLRFMRSSFRWLGLLGTLCLIGCGDSTSQPSASQETPDSQETADDAMAPSAASLPEPLDSSTAGASGPPPGNGGGERAPAEGGNAGERAAATGDGMAGSGDVADQPPGEPALPTDRLQLAADLPPAALIKFLGEADRELRTVAASATSAAEFEQLEPELRRLAGLKREAADRVIAVPSVPPALRKQAKRGRLQALSHLAAMGDLRAAEQLESEAERLADSSDPLLAIESRLVLIGFALDALQAGTTEDPQPIVELVSELTADAERLDMPALMAIGQTRAVLQQYGYEAAAQQVRDQLVLAFADHPDPELAALARQLAGTERFDRLDALQRSLERGETVTPTEWERAAKTVAEQAPDRLTLEYLASAALAFESQNLAPFAETTYELLRSIYADRETDGLSKELARILGSREARQEIVGTPLEIDLPGLQGEAIDWSRYRGKVVLVPFWAAEYPDSITIFPLLEQVRAADPDRIAILGVNLDLEDASVAALTSQIQPDWASVRSPDPADRGAQNALAQQVGLASMPFVVVVDPQGRVAAVSMTGDDLEQVVSRLLQEA